MLTLHVLKCIILKSWNLDIATPGSEPSIYLLRLSYITSVCSLKNSCIVMNVDSNIIVLMQRITMSTANILFRSRSQNVLHSETY